MKDPVRLLDEGATAAELSLLRAGMSEEPSAQAVVRLAAVLGVATSAAALTTATKSSAATVTKGAASKIAAKWLILGAVGVAGGAALVFAGATDRSTTSSALRATTTRIEETRATPIASAPARTGPSSGAGEAPASSAEPEAVHGVGGIEAEQPPAAERSEGAKDRVSSPSIAREIAALDVARRLLGSGNPRGALAALDDYEAEAKTGMLRQEATLLRIEALAGAGEASAARRLAHRFLQNHPHSPHEKRVRALVGESP